MLERAGARSAEHHSPLPVGNRRNVASSNASRSPMGERRGQALPATPKSVHAAAWSVEIAALIEYARTKSEPSASCSREGFNKVTYGTPNRATKYVTSIVPRAPRKGGCDFGLRKLVIWT